MWPCLFIGVVHIHVVICLLDVLASFSHWRALGQGKAVVSDWQSLESWRLGGGEDPPMSSWGGRTHPKLRVLTRHPSI